MKKGWLCGLMLAVLCLPAMALGESWADFVKRAEIKMEGATGVVVIEAQEPVAAYAAEKQEDSGELEEEGAQDWRMPEDVPLVAPKGVTLVLSGGEFSGLLLGGGQVELRGVTISGEAGQPAICLDEVRGVKDMTLRLTLDAQTSVTGQGVPTLANVPGNRQPWDLIIQNAGKLDAGGGATAVELQFWGDKNAALLLHNTGEIAGGEGVFIYTGPPTAYRVAVRNGGTITGQTFGLMLVDVGEKKANYIQILNEVGGVIESADPDSAAVCFNGLGKATCQLVNEGTLRGYHPLQLAYALGSYQPLEFLGDGEFITTGNTTVQVRLNLEGVEEAGLLDEAALTTEAEALLADGSLSMLPEYTTIGVSQEAEMDGETVQGLPFVLVTSPGSEVTSISWGEFRNRAASVTKQASGEAFLFLPGPVEAYTPDDKPLVVEAGPRLVVRGGQFSSMLLGSGEVELRGVTVETAEADQPAISIENQDKEIDLTLLLDADTVVRASGDGVAALRAVETSARPLTLSVVNHGRIESAQGDGVLLQPQLQGEHDATLSFANYGDIQGAGAGLTLAADTVLGTANVTLHNEGNVTGQSASGALVRSVSEDARILVEVENGTKGVIRSGMQTGLVLEIAESTLEGNYYGSSALVRNTGTIAGGAAAFEAMTPEVHPVLLQLRGTGTWQSEDGPVMGALLVQDNDEEPVSEELYEAGSAAWVNLAGRMYLPEDFDIAVSLHYRGNQDAEFRELYERTVYGGGQGMPDAALEAANYNLPIFVKYDGDGTLTLPEIRDDALLLKRVSDYDLRDDGTMWFRVGDKWKEERDYQRYFVEEGAPVNRFRRGDAIYSDGSPNWLFTFFVQHQKKSDFPDLTVDSEYYVHIDLSIYRKYLQSLYPNAALGVERDGDGIYHTTLTVGDQSITMPDTLPPEVFPGFWDYGDEPYDYQMYVESGGKVYINMDYAQFDVLIMAAIMDGNQPNVRLRMAE